MKVHQGRPRVGKAQRAHHNNLARLHLIQEYAVLVGTLRFAHPTPCNITGNLVFSSPLIMRVIQFSTNYFFINACPFFSNNNALTTVKDNMSFNTAEFIQVNGLVGVFGLMNMQVHDFSS